MNPPQTDAIVNHSASPIPGYLTLLMRILRKFSQRGWDINHAINVLLRETNRGGLLSTAVELWDAGFVPTSSTISAARDMNPAKGKSRGESRGGSDEVKDGENDLGDVEEKSLEDEVKDDGLACDDAEIPAYLSGGAPVQGSKGILKRIIQLLSAARFGLRIDELRTIVEVCCVGVISRGFL